MSSSILPARTPGIRVPQRLDHYEGLTSTRRTFAAGEEVLSQWMADNALVSWIAVPEPWVLERELFTALDLPLNLQGNAHNPFHVELTTVRAAAEARARTLPVVDT
ncbi:GIY-YIG nuclease family protein [Mycolicibacter sinensis]